MTLVVIFLAVTGALFALFWGGGLVAQSYLYNTPADRFVARSAAAAALVAGFLTLWAGVDGKRPGKYGTFFEFAANETKEVDAFDAVRWTADPAAMAARKPDVRRAADGKPVETVTTYRRQAGVRESRYTDPATGQPFVLLGGGAVTAALILKPDEAGPPVRFDAELQKDERAGLVHASGEPRFTEAGGSRYVTGARPGDIIISTGGAVAVALLLNVVHFAVWLVAFWLVMRFGLGHALVMAASFGLLTMLMVMPLLFKPGRQAAGVIALAGPGRSRTMNADPKAGIRQQTVFKTGERPSSVCVF